MTSRFQSIIDHIAELPETVELSSFAGTLFLNDKPIHIDTPFKDSEFGVGDNDLWSIKTGERLCYESFMISTITETEAADIILVVTKYFVAKLPKGKSFKAVINIKDIIQMAIGSLSGNNPTMYTLMDQPATFEALVDLGEVQAGSITPTNYQQTINSLTASDEQKARIIANGKLGGLGQTIKDEDVEHDPDTAFSDFEKGCFAAMAFDTTILKAEMHHAWYKGIRMPLIVGTDSDGRTFPLAIIPTEEILKGIQMSVGYALTKND